MKISSSINFKEITPADAKAISELYKSEENEYLKYFYPFSFDENDIENRLNSKEKDLYVGIYCNEILCGFYMLRGFDEGYTVPAYGVYVHSKFSKIGLASLSLFHAISTCKLMKVKKIMLKVHEDNIYAYRLYAKNGFVKTGFDDKYKQLILHKEL